MKKLIVTTVTFLHHRIALIQWVPNVLTVICPNLPQLYNLHIRQRNSRQTVSYAIQRTIGIRQNLIITQQRYSRSQVLIQQLPVPRVIQMVIPGDHQQRVMPVTQQIILLLLIQTMHQPSSQPTARPVTHRQHGHLPRSITIRQQLSHSQEVTSE